MHSGTDPWAAIARQIAAVTGAAFAIDRRDAVGGGCINSAWRITGDGQAFFVKVNDAAREAMFAAEHDGLEEIRRSGTVRVPAPVCHGSGGGRAWLVVEHLELGGRGGSRSAEALGRQLAAMHRCTHARFGWGRDNTIGTTPQPNAEMPDWVAFWRERRLGFQLGLAAAAGYGRRLQRGERLLEALPSLLAGHAPPASLLHGDLWSGNHAFTPDGTPVIFDPAVYYGDRETDVAMTELFGGFPSRFHAAYREAWPLDDGYALRRDLYNLYHVLNHLNLFGGGYLGQAETMIDRLLAALG